MKMSGVEKGTIAGIIAIITVQLSVLAAIAYAAVHFIKKFW